MNNFVKTKIPIPVVKDSLDIYISRELSNIDLPNNFPIAIQKYDSKISELMPEARTGVNGLCKVRFEPVGSFYDFSFKSVKEYNKFCESIAKNSTQIIDLYFLNHIYLAAIVPKGNKYSLSQIEDRIRAPFGV